MPRKLRVQVPDGLYHVTSRGCNRQAIYAGADTRQLHLALLAQVVEDCSWRCHAWVQMDNHFHLLIGTPEPNLSQGMQLLNGLYAQEYNAIVGRSGHLFQGRFHAVRIEREAHLLQATRYVVLNRVRCRAVADPAHWPWSSYSATAGLVKAPPFLTTDWILGRFGDPTTEACRARYRAFVAEGTRARSLRAVLAQTAVSGV